MLRMRVFCSGLLMLALAACNGPLATPRGPVSRAPGPDLAELPPMRTFRTTNPLPPMRSNTEIARDIVELAFFLENGVELPVLTRFNQPITIAPSGRTTTIFEHELDRLVERFRREARLDIQRLPAGSFADITVVGVTRYELQRIVPQAACFVLPARISWAEFSANSRRHDLDWTALRQREAASVFVPVDISPQEVRDCLHEEIAQALGPLNDLYRLEDSVFNDDNMHSVLTGFDMLVLRVLYDPALANGMARPQVAAALPAILARLNPRGAGYVTRPYQRSPSEWTDAAERSLRSDRFGAGRRRAARQALDIARQEGWTDTRMGLSLLSTARTAASSEPELTLSAFLQAADIYGAREATAVHAATVSVQIAAFALAAGEMESALRITGRYIPVAERAENAALLSDLLLIRATALNALGRTEEARDARLDALGWGRYGQRSGDALRARAAEIAALVPDEKGQT